MHFKNAFQNCISKTHFKTAFLKHDSKMHFKTAFQNCISKTLAKTQLNNVSNSYLRPRRTWPACWISSARIGSGTTSRPRFPSSRPVWTRPESEQRIVTSRGRRWRSSAWRSRCWWSRAPASSSSSAFESWTQYCKTLFAVMMLLI